MCARDVELELQKAIEQFLSHCRYERNLTEKTISAYDLDLRQFVSFLNGLQESWSVFDIDKELIKDYLRNVLTIYKPKSSRRKIATLKSFMGYLNYEDIISANPFSKIRIKIDREKQLPKTLTITQVKRLLQAAYDHMAESANDGGDTRLVVRDIAIIELLFSSGMRVSELCNLKTSDIDLETGRIKVFGKGRKERIIPICDKATLAALKTYSDSSNAGISNNGMFFLNRFGDGISDQSVRHLIRKYADLARLEIHVTPHMFRHTIATLLLENNVDIRNIQYLLGHSSISVTEIYVQINQGAHRKILEERHPRQTMNIQS